MAHKDIDLTNPNLGASLLSHAKGELPIDVWLVYFWQHSTEWKPVLAWCVDPKHPDGAPIDPQRAVDEAEPLIVEVIRHLMSNAPEEALDAARRAIAILVHGSSEYQLKPGQASSMRHQAVRAYILRKFSKDQKKSSWPQLADRLFNENGKCTRCGSARHQYTDNISGRCIKALTTAVNRLHAAMKDDGIPI